MTDQTYKIRLTLNKNADPELVLATHNEDPFADDWIKPLIHQLPVLTF